MEQFYRDENYYYCSDCYALTFCNGVSHLIPTSEADFCSNCGKLPNDETAWDGVSEEATRYIGGHKEGSEALQNLLD